MIPYRRRYLQPRFGILLALLSAQECPIRNGLKIFPVAAPRWSFWDGSRRVGFSWLNRLWVAEEMGSIAWAGANEGKTADSVAKRLTLIWLADQRSAIRGEMSQAFDPEEGCEIAEEAWGRE